MTDVFTKGVHGIRLKYAAVGVVFLLLAIGLFYLGGPQSFGWYTSIAILLLILMVLALFLLQCHFVLAPIERLTAAIDGLLTNAQNGSEQLRLQWNGKDEFSNLAAAINGLIDVVQGRGIGAQEENRHLRAIISSAEVELVAMNRNGSVLSVIHCPEGMDPIPGLARGFSPDSQIWGEENCAAFAKGLAAAFEKGGRQSVSLKFGEDAKVRRVTAFITRPNGGMFPIIVFRDEGSASDAKTTKTDREIPLARVAAGIAGDLKNSFTVIRNAVERYAQSERPEVRETIAMILKAIRSGSSMIEELETLGGELHLKLRNCLAADALAATRSTVEGLLENRGIRVSYNLEPGLPSVFVDQDKMNKVFVNLVQNSIEAFGAVPGRVTVSARPYSMGADEGPYFTPPVASGDGVLITVSDNGPGMQEHVRAHAFEPYCTTKLNGRGLGLPIANSIIAAHGGGMRITSVRGVSTEVMIFLRKSDRPAEDLEMLRKEFPGGEILVVDDNPAVLRITSALLRAQKIAAHCADIRKDAIRKFSELNERLRAVMLDAQLGDSNSVGLLSDIRAINPSVPVIVVSGYTAAQIKSIFAECPPNAYLMKPYTVDELKNVLDILDTHGGGGIVGKSDRYSLYYVDYRAR